MQINQYHQMWHIIAAQEILATATIIVIMIKYNMILA